MKKFGSKFFAYTENYSIILWPIIFFLITSSLTRIILIAFNISDLGGSILLIPVNLVVGIIFDLFVALCITLPLTALLFMVPVRWRLSRFFHWLISLAAVGFIYGCIYLGVAELFFFDEFSSRFNYVAVDYLIYPHEVFVNIWDTYPVLTFIILTVITSLIITWLSRKRLKTGLNLYPKKISHRFIVTLSHSLLIALMILPISMNLSRISENRVLNEITLNGVYSFVYSAFTNELDYNQYYVKTDETAAFHRLRRLIEDKHSTFLHNDSSGTIDRFVDSDRETHRFNIVLVLEESFGSNFIGCLNPEGPSLTPQFDSLAGQGMLFSHIYATGNRTVRGMEASLLSFPPIPGRSVVKRPGSEHLFSLPSVLKEMDYSTLFLYGGLSYFDNFGHFAANNGFDRVLDQMEIKNPIFKTIWGVSDEDLFNYSLDIFDSLSQDNKPFFATMITVSNHSPYTYPTGRIPYDPGEQRRENAVRYADYAIGKFLRDASTHSFFDSTLFVFLADHGARVYGSEEIPLRSYEIPVLFYNPYLIPSGQNIDVLGSQMDLAPTILDFLGIDYNSMFFGRSLLATAEDKERVLMSHNRDVSLLRNDTLAVLGIMENEELWQYDSTDVLRRITDSTISPLFDDAIAYYMTAYDMFIDKKLHPLEQTVYNRH